MDNPDFAGGAMGPGRSPTIEALIAALASPDGVERQAAREQLVEIGRPAVDPLLEMLKSASQSARWEAIKALGEIRDRRAAPAMVDALEDEHSAIRWLAAKGLIALGAQALPPLLEALEKESDSVWMREGAHHVLHTLARDGVAEEVVPVLEALEDIEPAVEVPNAAYHALQALRAKEKVG